MIDDHDAFLFDLDGVIWRGEAPLPGAAETVASLRALGKRVLFVTNNSSSTARDYAVKLMRMRMPTDPNDIVTSAHVVAEHLGSIGLGRSDRVHLCGSAGFATILKAAGFAPTREVADVLAVAVGWKRDLTFDDIRRAADVARGGAPFVGANRDATYPSEDGLVPGSGSILAAIETASGRRATVVGKPQPEIIRQALARAGVANHRAVFVGDRADTDVAGARAAGVMAVLVLTGVTTERDLGSLDVQPDLILEGVADLLDPSVVVEGVRESRSTAPSGREDVDQR